ncbi:hypothetical protein BCR42DRAFT_407903 [Absidia repens]|uniref:DH domain-containing protein n=1 Tax=Absidia repens TaxID=90262 RepID=A0A1X2ISS2_9FUNG|nr:hypothetical protein BCR42DRAFT_407903 [Absidia repens]
MNSALFSSTMDDHQSKQHLLTVEKQYMDLLNLIVTKLAGEKEVALRNWLSTIEILEKYHQDLYQKLDSSGQNIRTVDIIIDWGNSLETPYMNYLKSYDIVQKQHENLLCASIKNIIKHLPTTSPFNSIDTLLAAPFDHLKLYKSIFSPLLESSDSSKQNTLKQVIQTIDTVLKQSPQRMVNSATATDLVSFQKYVDSENVIDLFTGSHLDYQLRPRPGKIVLQDDFLLLADNNDHPAQRIHMVLTTDILMICKQLDESTGRYDLLYPPLAVNDILVQPLMLDRELIGEYTLQFTVLSKNMAVRAESREVRNAWTGVPLTTTAKNANKTSIPLMNVVRFSETDKNGVNLNTKSDNGAFHRNTPPADSSENEDENGLNGIAAPTPKSDQHSLVGKKSLPTVPAQPQPAMKGNIIPPPKDLTAPVINIAAHEDTKINTLMQSTSKEHQNIKQRGSSIRPQPSNPPYNPHSPVSSGIESKPLPGSTSARNRVAGSASQNPRPQMNTSHASNRATQSFPHQLQHQHPRQSTSSSSIPQQHQQRGSSHGAANTQHRPAANGHSASRTPMSSQSHPSNRPNAPHPHPHPHPQSLHHQSQQRPPPQQSQPRSSQHYQPHQRPVQHNPHHQRPPSHQRLSHHQPQQRPPQNYHSQQRHPQQRPPQQRPPPSNHQHSQQQRPPPPHQQQPRPRPPHHHSQPPAPVPTNTSKPLPQNFNNTPAIAAVASPSSPSTSAQRPMPPTPPPQKPQFNAALPNPDGASQIRSSPVAGSQESFGSSLQLSPEDLATPPRSPNPYNNQTNGIRQVIFRNQQCEVFRWNDESWYAVDGQCLLEVRQTFTNRSCIAIRVQTTGELYLNAWVLPQTQIRLASPTDVSLGLVMGSQQETYLVHFEQSSDATELNQVLQKMHHAAVMAARQPNDGQRTLRGDPPTEMMMYDDDEIEESVAAVATTTTDGSTAVGRTLTRSSSLMQSGQEPTPIPQTLQPAMQCKCKLFVQNEHSNWSSFGSVQLVVSLQVPSRRMHIQIDHDKKRGLSKIIPTGGSSASPTSPSSSSPNTSDNGTNSATSSSSSPGGTVVAATSANTLVSATVYSNNVERLGAKRISFLLVNERERTSSMVYMVQLREEESGNTLYDYLKIKNAQNGW